MSVSSPESFQIRKSPVFKSHRAQLEYGTAALPVLFPEGKGRIFSVRCTTGRFLIKKKPATEDVEGLSVIIVISITQTDEETFFFFNLHENILWAAGKSSLAPMKCFS